jgi:hypothetical protein
MNNKLKELIPVYKKNFRNFLASFWLIPLLLLLAVSLATSVTAQENPFAN